MTYVPRQSFNYKGFMGGVPVKHRKIRRVNPAGVSGFLITRSLEAAVFVLLSFRRRGCTPVSCRAASLRSSFKSRMPGRQPGDAGAIPADRTNFQNTRWAPACAAKSPKLCLLGAAPRRRANFNNCGVAKWEGSGLISRSRAGSIPAPANQSFLGCSIIQEVARLASGRARCKAVAVHHFQNHLWVGSRVKTAARL